MIRRRIDFVEISVLNNVLPIGQELPLSLHRQVSVTKQYVEDNHPDIITKLESKHIYQIYKHNTPK